MGLLYGFHLEGAYKTGAVHEECIGDVGLPDGYIPGRGFYEQQFLCRSVLLRPGGAFIQIGEQKCQLGTVVIGDVIDIDQCDQCNHKLKLKCGIGGDPYIRSEGSELQIDGVKSQCRGHHHAQHQQRIPRPYMLPLYKQVLMEAHYEATGVQNDLHQKYKKQIEAVEKKLSYARDLLFSKEIEPEDFHKKKSEYEEEIRALNLKVSESRYEGNIREVINRALDVLKLNVIFSSATIEEKQRLLTKLFPEKFTIVDRTLRTDRINRIAEFIYLINSKLPGADAEIISTKNSEKDIKEERGLRTATSKQNGLFNGLNISSLYENKKGQNSFYTILSSQVGKTGFEPATPWSQTRCATGLRYFPKQKTAKHGRLSGMQR